MEYLIFDQDFLDIPLQDYPEYGDLIVCHDPQNRCKDPDTGITWVVVICQGTKNAPRAIGLFWDKEEAVLFAELRSAK